MPNSETFLDQRRGLPKVCACVFVLFVITDSGKIMKKVIIRCYAFVNFVEMDGQFGKKY